MELNWNSCSFFEKSLGILWDSWRFWIIFEDLTTFILRMPVIFAAQHCRCSLLFIICSCKMIRSSDHREDMVSVWNSIRLFILVDISVTWVTRLRNQVDDEMVNWRLIELQRVTNASVAIIITFSHVIDFFRLSLASTSNG